VVVTPFRGEPATPDDEPSESLRSAEREHVVRVLQQTRGNKKAAAARLGVSRRSLYRLLERHGLEAQIKARPRPEGAPQHEAA
jgi:DNA-binding NtrC family response regulator